MLHPPQAVPYEIRSAKRTAATALLVSAAAFLCSLGVVIHKHTAGAPVTMAPAVSAAVGLSEEEPLQKVAAEIGGLLNQARGVEFGIRPVPHHLVAPMSLRAEPSADSAVQWQMPAGVQVFPLSSKFGWFQVVVPETEIDGVQQKAAFGWLPEHTDEGTTLLVEDKELKNRKYSEYRAAPPSQAEVNAKWDEARAKNKELQAQVAELQRSMAEQRPGQPQLVEEAQEDQTGDEERGSNDERRSKGGAAVKAEAAKVVDLSQLSKSVHQLHSLTKDLKTDKLMNSLGKAFG